MNNIPEIHRSQYLSSWTAIARSLWALWEKEGWFQTSKDDPVVVPQIKLPDCLPRLPAIGRDTRLRLVYLNSTDHQRHREPRGCSGFLIKLVDLGYLKEMKPSWAKILVAIIAHIGKDGWAEVDQDTLAKEAGVSRRSVNNFISWARDAGLLIVDRRKRNRYSLGFEKRPKFADLCQGMIKKGQLAKLFWQHVKVLLALYRHRNKQGFAFPTKRLLAKEAGVSVDTVSRFLDRAWLAELIDIQPGKNSHRRKPFGPSVGQSPEVSRRRSNTYRLTWGEKAKLEWLTPLERPRLKRAEKTELPNI